MKHDIDKLKYRKLKYGKQYDKNAGCLSDNIA